MKNSPQIIDLSWELSDKTPVYPGDPVINVSGERLKDSDGFSLKTLTTAMHVGTHLDAPSHYLASGSSVESIPLDKTIGFATKIKVSLHDNLIKTEEIDMAYHNAYQKHSKIVIETGFSNECDTPEYFQSFPAFEPSIIDFLLDNQIELIGVDMPSVRFFKSGSAEAHHAILGHDIVIVENLINLDKLDDEFFLLCQPLKLSGFDGSLIRAVGINRWKTFY